MRVAISCVVLAALALAAPAAEHPFDGALAATVSEENDVRGALAAVQQETEAIEAELVDRAATHAQQPLTAGPVEVDLREFEDLADDDLADFLDSLATSQSEHISAHSPVEVPQGGQEDELHKGADKGRRPGTPGSPPPPRPPFPPPPRGKRPPFPPPPRGKGPLFPPPPSDKRPPFPAPPRGGNRPPPPPPGHEHGFPRPLPPDDESDDFPTPPTSDGEHNRPPPPPPFERRPPPPPFGRRPLPPPLGRRPPPPPPFGCRPPPPSEQDEPQSRGRPGSWRMRGDVDEHEHRIHGYSHPHEHAGEDIDVEDRSSIFADAEGDEERPHKHHSHRAHHGHRAHSHSHSHSVRQALKHFLHATAMLGSALVHSPAFFALWTAVKVVATGFVLLRLAEKVRARWPGRIRLAEVEEQADVAEKV
ncbi:hypothetical protein JCM10213_002111 [Rhodosporidiobolus nylandii]